MLILSRKLNERIVIGEAVEVVVLAVHGDAVKLGFVAPADVAIHREEVHQRIQAEIRSQELPPLDKRATAMA